MAATPAIVAAERAGVEFSVHSYEHDPASPSYGLEASEKLGLDPARVFKTLVVETESRLGVALVPVELQLDLKALEKRSSMAPKEKAERATGYVLGGISPLGQRRALPTVVDESALGHGTIYVSAGRRGLELELAPGDLVRLTNADVRPIAISRKREGGG